MAKAMRPPWATAYDKASKGGVTQGEQNQASAPQTIKTAEKLVDNLLKAPEAVQDAVQQGLKLGRMYPHLATEEGRKSS